MKYMLLVCWDAEQMDAQNEPGPTDTPDEKSFPWLDDLQARGMWLTGPTGSAAPGANRPRA